MSEPPRHGGRPQAAFAAVRRSPEHTRDGTGRRPQDARVGAPRMPG